jgi:hypothetical protein
LTQTLQAQSSFGGAVAVSNGLVVIGTPLYKPSTTTDGAVYHYYCNPTCGATFTTKIGTAASGSQTGAAVAVSYVTSNTWVVAFGAPKYSTSTGQFVYYTCTSASCGTSVTTTGAASDLVSDVEIKK